MHKTIKNFILSASFILSFIVWTMLLLWVDVDGIGPGGSRVGFSTFNSFFHNLTGVNMTLYNITDWLGLVPIFLCLVFAIMGLVQWIKRRNILKVDFSILVLGGFYILVIVAYILFEYLVINYRPILINNYLEASYPSSTTMLTMCVMPTAILQLNSRIKNKKLRMLVNAILWAFTLFMVIARLISGVHWISDIIGGALISAGLVTLYHAVIGCFKKFAPKQKQGKKKTPKTVMVRSNLFARFSKNKGQKGIYKTKKCDMIIADDQTLYSV